MSVKIHLEGLRRKHLVLSEQIEAEQQRPSFCALSVKKLKKKRLQLKETIIRFNKKILN